MERERQRERSEARRIGEQHPPSPNPHTPLPLLPSFLPSLPGRKPRRIAALRGRRIVQAAIGGWHCLAVDEGGQAWAWGGNEYAQCGFPPAPRPPAESSAAGAPGGRGGWAAAAALSSGGDGGVNTPTTPAATAAAAAATAGTPPAPPAAEWRDVASPVPVAPDLEVVQVSAGGMQSAALTSTGHVWAWGEPWGDFSVVLSRAPRPVPFPGGPAVAKVACGAFHTLALTASGAVFAWGANDFGQLGTGTTSPAVTPAPVLGLEGVPAADLAAGGWHSLALAPDGGVYVWGRGEYGRLGLGPAEGGASRLRATRLAALDGAGVVQASAGGTHTVALTGDGRVFAWGRGSFGRLGTGDDRDRHAPVQVRLPGGPDRWHAVCVSAGGRHSLALALPCVDTNLDARGGGGGGGEGSSDGGGGMPPPPPPQPALQGRPRPSELRAGAAGSPAGTLARPPPPPAPADPILSDDGGEDGDDASQPDEADPDGSSADGGGGGGLVAGGLTAADAAAEAAATAPPPPRAAGRPGSSAVGGDDDLDGGSSGAATPGPPGAGRGDDDDDEDDPALLAAVDPAHSLAAAMARAALSHAELEDAAREMHAGAGGEGGGAGRPRAPRQRGRGGRGGQPPSRLGGAA